jgi:hypothetical protein
VVDDPRVGGHHPGPTLSLEVVTGAGACFPLLRPSGSDRLHARPGRASSLISALAGRYAGVLAWSDRGGARRSLGVASRQLRLDDSSRLAGVCQGWLCHISTTHPIRPLAPAQLALPPMNRHNNPAVSITACTTGEVPIHAGSKVGDAMPDSVCEITTELAEALERARFAGSSLVPPARIELAHAV